MLLYFHFLYSFLNFYNNHLYKEQILAMTDEIMQVRECFSQILHIIITLEMPISYLL